MSWERIEERVERALECLHRIEVTQARQELILEKNTDELEEHIRRTDLLEKKLRKIYMFALIATGFVAAKYGTEIVKIIGIAI